jgi:EpsI family protein
MGAQQPVTSDERTNRRLQRVINWRFLAAGMLLVGASGLAYALRPVPVVDVRDIDLERQIPEAFGQWHEVRTGMVQVDLAPRGENGEQEATLVWPYDRTLTRVYQRGDGQVVMLALAWGSKQRQEIKVHRPELCYAGQGLQVIEQKTTPLELSSAATVLATHMLTRGAARLEPVTYWIRTGDRISLSSWQSRFEILKEGVRGRIPDGILVRVSQALPPTASPEASYQIQASFLSDLYAAADPAAKRLLVGNRPG